MRATATVFPTTVFESVLSFSGLLDFWRAHAHSASSPHQRLARTILDAVEQAPELQGPIIDLAVCERHRELLDLMLTAVLPPALWQELHAAVVPPFQLQPVYMTPAFAQLTRGGTADVFAHLNMDEATLHAGKTIRAYSLILEQFYDAHTAFEYPLIFSLRTAEGLDRHFRVQIDTRFCTIRPRGALPPLTEADLQRLTADPMNLALWMELLPPDGFIFEGFSIITAIDVTDQEVVSALKNDLLQKDAMTTPEQIDHLQRRLRSLLRFPDLQLGLIGVERATGAGALPTARAIGRSLLLHDGRVPLCSAVPRSVHGQAAESTCEPVIVGDLMQMPERTEFEEHLLARGLRTLLVAPLCYEGRLVGLLELAAPRANLLNALNTVRLRSNLSLFATALKRSMDEREDRIQALIKEKYTAIHPLVEWRFRKAAQHYLEQQAQGRTPRLEPIVFNDVYPLYGLSDIRNSSTMRAAAVQDDLLEQLGLALAVIVAASVHRPLPALDEIGYRINSAIVGIDSGLRSEDEVSVLEFLRQDVEPLFEQIAAFGPDMPERVAAYRNALDPHLGIFYQKRKDFEESMAMVNDTISTYLEAQDRHAQQMFPHYFEKYKTDGVDYNIYVGNALLEHGRFDELYLHNLRLWQLMMKCGVIWEMERLKPQLKVPMETTHLILVQSAPLAIRFRQDEKKFDVDGAYNIRYEIIKKRIDKALVRGTGERLTQPGHIAIVYNHVREAQEYHRYFDYLQSAGYLAPGIEELELEDLQGTYGLKALRVTVRPEPPESDILVEARRAAQLMA